MNAINCIVVERTFDGLYHIVEHRTNGFLVLGTYADKLTAEKHARRFRAELAESN